VAMDSSPLGAAGRVEDTVNLLAHAARKLKIRRTTLAEKMKRYAIRSSDGSADA
jgi:DNA-binding NtrC family response regulator